MEPPPRRLALAAAAAAVAASLPGASVAFAVPPAFLPSASRSFRSPRTSRASTPPGGDDGLPDLPGLPELPDFSRPVPPGPPSSRRPSLMSTVPGGAVPASDPADRPSLSVDTGGVLALKMDDEADATLPIDYVRPDVWRDAGDAFPGGAGVELITFDAVGTLIRMTTGVGMFYREALMAAADHNVRLPRPDIFADHFKEAFRAKNAASPCYGKFEEGTTAEGWWRDVVADTYRSMYDIFMDDDLVEELESEDGEVFELAFRKLYDEDFMGEEAWELCPDAYRVLRRLALWRSQGGPKIGILSNYDDRLRTVLYNLGVDEYFDFVLTSEGTGFPKPDAAVFDLARRYAGVADPAKAAHVGNDLDLDCFAARDAGWHGIWIHGDQYDLPEGADDGGPFSTAGDLVGVLSMYGVAPESREILTTRDIYEEGNYGFHDKTWDDCDYGLENREFKEWSTNTD